MNLALVEGGRRSHVTPSFLRLPPLSELFVGETVPGTAYSVLDRLRAGGMGAIYEVRHDLLGRTSVLKVLHPRHRSRADHAERLRDEARVLARLHGAPVPIVFDTGALEDGRPFFTMERLRGGDLRAELRRFGVLSVPTAVAQVAALLAVLEEVHARSVIHCDIKADNVFLGEDGKLSLIDFGVSMDLERAHASSRPCMMLGTPRSMAPEQHEAAGVDERTDLYAVGLLLHELVVGRGPFDHHGSSAAELRFAHTRCEPASPSRHAPQMVPREVARVIGRALAKAPDARYANASSMREALLEAGAMSLVDDETTVDLWTDQDSPGAFAVSSTAVSRSDPGTGRRPGAAACRRWPSHGGWSPAH